MTAIVGWDRKHNIGKMKVDVDTTKMSRAANFIDTVGEISKCENRTGLGFPIFFK